MELLIPGNVSASVRQSRPTWQGIMSMPKNKTRHSDDLHSGKAGDTHPGNNKGKEPQKGDGEAAAKAAGGTKTTGKTPKPK